MKTAIGIFVALVLVVVVVETVCFVHASQCPPDMAYNQQTDACIPGVRPWEHP